MWSNFTPAWVLNQTEAAVADHLTDNWMFCVQDTGPGLSDDADAAPLAHQIHESTLTVQAAEEAHPEDRTAADIAKAPTSPSLTKAPPAGEIPAKASDFRS